MVMVIAVFCTLSGRLDDSLSSGQSLRRLYTYTADRLGGEIQHVGKRVFIRLRYQVEQAKIAEGTPAAVPFLYHV
jgi:hypothetical protein